MANVVCFITPSPLHPLALPHALVIILLRFFSVKKLA